MNLQDVLRNAAANLVEHTFRSVLTMLGIIFGVGAVIAMLAIGAGAQRQAMEMIERLGLHNVLVRDAQLRDDELEEVRRNSPGVSPRDGIAIEDAVPGVELVAGQVDITSYAVLTAGVTTTADVKGVSWHQRELAGLKLSEGRFLDAVDERDHAQVCVIGPGIRRDLFGYGPAIGRDLKVNDVWLEVVGVLAGAGGGAGSFQGVAIASSDRAILLPVTTALRKFEREPLKAPLNELTVRLAEDEQPSVAAGLISALLDRLHSGARDFKVVVPEALLEQSRKTQRLFAIVMGCIAGISLLVGGIGIMNIMLATVLERTREIGVRRALGARRKDILALFLVESFAISLAGGVTGVVVGIAIAKIVAASAGWPTVVTAFSVILSTGVAMAVGLASGIYPAMRAAKLDPIEALRYE